MTLPKSAKEARLAGASRYFTGTPCKFGHISERLTCSKNCVTCQSLWQKGELDPASAIADGEWRRLGCQKSPALAHLPASRDEARLAGAKRFFDGKPCKNGHFADRNTLNGVCCDCLSRKEKGYAARNPQKRRVPRGCPERRKARRKAWGRENAAVLNAKTVARLATKAKRTPGWLTESQHQAIRMVYKAAKFMSESTGVPHEVDHIVPLHGKIVSGLHVPWNLRVVPATVNRRKYNIMCLSEV